MLGLPPRRNSCAFHWSLILVSSALLESKTVAVVVGCRKLQGELELHIFLHFRTCHVALIQSHLRCCCDQVPRLAAAKIDAAWLQQVGSAGTSGRLRRQRTIPRLCPVRCRIVTLILVTIRHSLISDSHSSIAQAARLAHQFGVPYPHDMEVRGSRSARSPQLAPASSTSRSRTAPAAPPPSSRSCTSSPPPTAPPPSLKSSTASSAPARPCAASKPSDAICLSSCHHSLPPPTSLTAPPSLLVPCGPAQRTVCTTCLPCRASPNGSAPAGRWIATGVTRWTRKTWRTAG